VRLLHDRCGQDSVEEGVSLTSLPVGHLFTGVDLGYIVVKESQKGFVCWSVECTWADVGDEGRRCIVAPALMEGCFSLFRNANVGSNSQSVAIQFPQSVSNVAELRSRTTICVYCVCLPLNVSFSAVNQ